MENLNQGVWIDHGAHHNSVQGNEIFENHGGILVANGSLYNTLRGNKITGNRGKGIELTSGGNNSIPAPVIDEFSIEGGRIQGYVEGSVPRGSIVDVFADIWDQGAKYLGSYQLTSNRFYLKSALPYGMHFHLCDLQGFSHPDRQGERRCSIGPRRFLMYRPPEHLKAPCNGAFLFLLDAPHRPIETFYLIFYPLCPIFYMTTNTSPLIGSLIHPDHVQEEKKEKNQVLRGPTPGGQSHPLSDRPEALPQGRLC